MEQCLFTMPHFEILFNPIALRKAEIVCNFGLSVCNRVKSNCKGVKSDVEKY